jgi:hypothetical protein
MIDSTNTKIPSRDRFRSRQIALRMPLMHDVIAGKTLTGIARERGQPLHEIDNLFGQLIEWLRICCDPYFPVQHPAAVAVRPGIGLPQLVREHASLYLALADQHARMAALSKIMTTLSETQRDRIDITAGDMFPPYLQTQFASKQIATLGALLGKSATDLRQEKFNDTDISNIDKMLRRYGLELAPILPSWHANAETTATPIEVLNLTLRAINCLRSEGISTVGQVAGMSDTDLLNVPNLGRKSIMEIRQNLVSFGPQFTAEKL